MAGFLGGAMSGRRQLRALLAGARPVVAPGAYDALSARLVCLAGFDAVYMTGFGTAASLLGRPDVGLLGMSEMADNARRIVGAVDVPVIADADTGYGNAINVVRTVQDYERAGVAALHLEDQVAPKRCGHMEGKHVIPAGEMVGKIEAAVAARRDPDLVIIARTDARAPLGLSEAVARGRRYSEAGADLVFVEALENVAEIEAVARDLSGIPLVFNWAEGGKTPPLALEQLASLGFALVILPLTLLLSATRAMEAALSVVRRDGTPVGLDLPSFGSFLDVIGLPEIDELGRRFSGPDQLD